MRTFLKKLLLFAALQALILVPLLLRYPGQDNTWLLAAGDKRAAARRARPPRVLVVGGSGVAFSVDTRVLQERLQRPSINLGLHVGLGLAYMLEEAEQLAGPGDVVVLVPEYEHFTRDMTGTALVQLLEQEPGSLRYVPPAELKSLVDRGLVWLRKILARGLHPRRRPDDPIYARESFDALGNLRAHAGLGSRYEVDEGPPLVPDPVALEAACDLIEASARRLSTRSARLVLAWPAFSRSAWELWGGVAGRLATRARQQLSIVALLSPEEAVFPDAWFYDSRYHALPAASGPYSTLLSVRLLPLLR